MDFSKAIWNSPMPVGFKRYCMKRWAKLNEVGKNDWCKIEIEARSDQRDVSASYSSWKWSTQVGESWRVVLHGFPVIRINNGLIIDQLGIHGAKFRCVDLWGSYVSQLWHWIITAGAAFSCVFVLIRAYINGSSVALVNQGIDIACW